MIKEFNYDLHIKKEYLSWLLINLRKYRAYDSYGEK